MKNSTVYITLFILLSALTSSVEAKQFYYHKANVPRDMFQADYDECIELAGGVHQVKKFTPYSPNVIVTGTTAFLAGFLNAGEARYRKDNVLRTCMTSKGYSRREADDDIRDRIRHLPENKRMDALFSLASTNTAIPDEVRP